MPNEFIQPIRTKNPLVNPIKNLNAKNIKENLFHFKALKIPDCCRYKFMNVSLDFVSNF